GAMHIALGQFVHISFLCIPRLLACQMDTSFRLGWSGAHNTIHSREITEMLKATPQRFGSWVVTAAAPHKAAPLCDPAHGFAPRGWLVGWRRTVMDDPRE